MSEPRVETCYIQSAETTVTSTRAVLNGTTYAMANVTSVKMGTVPPDAGWFFVLAFGLAVVALGGVVWAKDGVTTAGLLLAVAFGSVFIALGVWAYKQARPTYLVILGTAGGELHAQHSKDRPQIASIVDAISRAIVERG